MLNALKLPAFLLFAAVAGACATDMAAPKARDVEVVSASRDAGGTPNASSGITENFACLLNSATCATQFAWWWLKVDDHGDSFTNTYYGPNGDHVDIKASWIVKDVSFCIDSEKGRIDGVKLEDIVTKPRGLGRAACL